MMQKKRLSSVDKEFYQSLRKYDEIPQKRQSINLRKEVQLQEQQIIVQDIDANISDLENGLYQKAFTGISILFTDPNYLIRKHLTFQLFVPEEKNFFGFAILSKKEIWILLLIYFNLINQEKNQYARHLWQSVIKKMTDYLNYEVKEEVLQKVKLFEEKSKLSNQQNKQQPIKKTFKTQEYLSKIEEVKFEENFEEKINNVSKIEIFEANFFEKSQLATVSENSFGDINQIPEQNELILICEQFETATLEEVSAPQNSSIDLQSDLADLTHQQSNFPNDIAIPELSFQQLSQTEDAIRHYSITTDQVSNQVEISLIQQMEQFGLSDNQNEQLNNAQICESNIEEEMINQIKEESVKFVDENLQEQNNNQQIEKTNTINQKNSENVEIINDAKQENLNNLEEIDFQSFSSIEMASQSQPLQSETPHFTQNQCNFESQTSLRVQNQNENQLAQQQQNNEENMQNFVKKLSFQSISKQNQVIQEENQDKIETKLQERSSQKNNEINEEISDFKVILDEKRKISSTQKTLDEYFKLKPKHSICTLKFDDQSNIDEKIQDQNKKRRSRVCRIMQQAQHQNIQEFQEFQEMSQKKKSKLIVEEQVIVEENKSEDKKQKRKSANFDSRYDQNFLDKHGSGFRYDVVKAPQQFQEKFHVSEILVPRRSSKRLSYPEKSDIEIEKMVVVNNEILNYFKPADKQSQMISEQIEKKNLQTTYLESFNKNDKKMIICMENDKEYFVNDIVQTQILMENINDNESHNIVKIKSQQFLDRIAIAQTKKQSSEQILFEDYNYYNNYIQFHYPQMNPIYLPLGSYLINSTI